MVRLIRGFYNTLQIGALRINWGASVGVWVTWRGRIILETKPL